MDVMGCQRQRQRRHYCHFNQCDQGGNGYWNILCTVTTFLGAFKILI